jgi:hypothetical protein
MSGNLGVPIEVLLDPHRSLVRTVLRYVESIPSDDATSPS